MRANKNDFFLLLNFTNNLVLISIKYVKKGI